MQNTQKKGAVIRCCSCGSGVTVVNENKIRCSYCNSLVRVRYECKGNSNEITPTHTTKAIMTDAQVGLSYFITVAVFVIIAIFVFMPLLRPAEKNYLTLSGGIINLGIDEQGLLRAEIIDPITVTNTGSERYEELYFQFSLFDSASGQKHSQLFITNSIFDLGPNESQQISDSFATWIQSGVFVSENLQNLSLHLHSVRIRSGDKWRTVNN